MSSGGTIGAGGGGAGGSVGAGGAVGSGGNAGSGGSTGSGGAAASGGSVGSGGSGGSGGSTGAGGKAGMGGAGGSAGAAGGAGAVGSGGAGGTGACGDLLDDMEAGTGHICQGNGRVGYWYTYIDSNLGSSITPPASENPTLPQMPTLSRVATSTRAMHASGSYSSFAGIGFLVNAPVINDPWSTFDASGYSGIVFWAMGTGTARVLLQIPATVATQYNGTCVTSACMGAVSHSYQLSANSWNEIAVPFSALTSGNTTFLPSVLAAIEFQPTTPGTFDLWIDDVRFY